MTPTLPALLAPLLLSAAGLPPPGQDAADAARARRIAEQTRALEATVAAAEKFGHGEEFAAAARKLLEHADYRFLRVKEGSVTDVALQRFLAWNVAEEEGEGPGALLTSRPHHPFGAIVDLARQLRAHDVDFLLVTFPSKPELYPDLMLDLPSMEGFAGMGTANARFLLELCKAGIEVLDLTPDFVAARHVADDPHDLLFLQDNQHWTPRAVELAAKRIAARVAQFPWYRPGPAEEGRDFAVKPMRFEFKLAYGPSPPWSAPETLRANQVRKIGLGLLQPIAPDSPILVLSDSFSEFHKPEACDLSSQLFRFLGQPIDLLNPKGGAGLACRDALRRRPQPLRGKQLLIWLVCDQNFEISRDWRKLAIVDAPKDDGEEKEPAPAAPASHAAAAPADGTPPADSARAARLAAQEKELEASLATVRAFGHGEEFLAAVRRLAAGAGDSKWVAIDDGFLPQVTLERYAIWSSPAPGAKDPVAVEFDLPGHPGPVIVDLARQLREHGVDFLCVTFPSRVQLYPEVVPGLGLSVPDGVRFGGMVEANTRFLLELVRQGVEVVDLAPVFAAARRVKDDPRDLLYLRGNLHWTPRASELAAKTVAGRVRALPWFTPGPWREGEEFTVAPRRIVFSSDFNGEAPGAPPETIVADAIKPKTTAPATMARWNGPIAVLSDSFANFEDDRLASFRAQLERFTSWPVDLIAPDGGAELACREALARRDQPLRGKKLVIWLLQEPNLRPLPQFRPVEIVPN